MSRSTIVGGASAAFLVLLAVVYGYWTRNEAPQPVAAASSAMAPLATPAEADTRPAVPDRSFLYGRITATDGATYEGRLRWGEEGDQEAFWGDYFNGSKSDNPWRAQVPPERLPKARYPVEIFGIEIARRDRPMDLRRRFMARFGDIARIEVHGRDVIVTLRSGAVANLDRYEASDFDDGVRVWDASRGVVDLDSSQIGTIEFLPTPALDAAPSRLYGTVRTPQGNFTGFVQWDRQECVGTDTLDGRAAEGDLNLRFDTIRSIERRARDGSLVTLIDGREIVLSDTNDVDRGNRGVYVDDRRYGRVLISWGAFERIDFSVDGVGPTRDGFPPGGPLTGTVTTRGGSRYAGRLVYDLDESETTETLDAPSQGVDYTIPFGLVASIVPAGLEEPAAPRARVTLHDGEALQLERAGDLGPGNAGVLIFVEGAPHAEYVPWADVERIDFDRAPVARGQ